MISLLVISKSAVPPFLLRGIVFLLLLMAQPALAVTWSQEISVPLEENYDTNPLMTSSNATSVWRSIISPHYILTGVKDLNRWYADATLRVERTSDQDVSINREDPALTLGWKHEMEKGEFGFRLHYDEASSRTTQLLETGQVVGADATRVSKSVGVDWEKYLTEKMSLALTAETNKVTFTGGTTPDYRSHMASANLGYIWSERLEPFLQLSLYRYEPQDNQAPTNLYTAVAGVKLKASERMDITVNGGLNRSTGASQDTGWQGGVDMNYVAEKHQWRLGLLRSLAPAGNGGFIESDQAIGSWGYELSDRSRTGLDLSLRKNHGDSQSETSRIGAWYAYELNSFWNFRASCSHRESSNSGLNANANVLGLTLTFTHPDF